MAAADGKEKPELRDDCRSIASRRSGGSWSWLRRDLQGPALGLAAGGGFLAVFGVFMAKYAVSDSKRGLAAAQVQRKTEEAWNAEALGRRDKAETIA